jgi:hypothetical protein
VEISFEANKGGGERMKKTLSVLMITFIVLILVTILFGCAGVTQTQIEQKYGSPAKKEVVDDKIIYYYYFSGRRQRIPYERYENVCWEFTFDRDGKLINKRKYFPQPKLEEVK